MSQRRIQGAALLILLAIPAAVGVEALAAGNPLRMVAGLALLLMLPWLAASRLAPLRRGEAAGSRLSASGALTFALIVLLGLLLSTTSAGITTDEIVAGALVLTAVLAFLGTPGERPSLGVGRRLTSPLGLALVAVAVAISVFAFLLARDRALTQAREETSYAAFLIGDGKRLSVGLKNSTDRPARFSVRDLRRGPGGAVSVRVPGHAVGVVPGFVAKPPSLRPRQRLDPVEIEPVEIRVDVSAGGRRAGPPLKLSTFAP
jgi:hypothetical protein